MAAPAGIARGTLNVVHTQDGEFRRQRLPSLGIYLVAGAIETA